MNIIALVHFLSGLVVVAVSIPLVRRKIGRNAMYGFRIPAAFASEQRWLEINAYGGRIFLRWGGALIVFGLGGMFLPERLWLRYAAVSVAPVLWGLFLAVLKTMKYAERLERQAAE